MNNHDQALLNSLRARSPGWVISPAGSQGEWQALSRPTQRSEHVVVARTLKELAEKLAKAE